MSQLFVDEIREHTSGAGVLVLDRVIARSSNTGFDLTGIDVLFVIEGGDDSTQSVQYGLLIDLHENSSPPANTVLYGIRVQLLSPDSRTDLSYQLGVDSTLISGKDTIHTFRWAYYAAIFGRNTPGNIPVGGLSMYNFRGEDIAGSAQEHAQLSLGAVSGATVNNYGILIGNVTGTGAFAIKTGLGMVLFGTADPAYSNSDILFEVSGGQNFIAQYRVGAVISLEGSSTFASNTYMSGIDVNVRSATSAIGSYLIGVSSYLTPGPGAVHTQIWAFYAQANPSGGGSSVYNFRGEPISGAGAVEHAQISLGSVSDGTVHNYGIFVGNVTGTGAFAIKTNTGVVSIGDLLLTTASASSGAKFRLPHGTAPSSPVDGDIWTTTAGIFVRINGVTVGPLT